MCLVQISIFYIKATSHNVCIKSNILATISMDHKADLIVNFDSKIFTNCLKLTLLVAIKIRSSINLS